MLKNIPTFTNLKTAQEKAALWQYNLRRRHYIVMGECTEDRQEFYVATVKEAKKLIEAGFEVLE